MNTLFSILACTTNPNETNSWFADSSPTDTAATDSATTLDDPTPADTGIIEVPEGFFIDDTTAPNADGDYSRITTCDDAAVYQSYTAFAETAAIPLAVHVLRNSDGSAGLGDLQDIDDAVAVANAYFDDLNVAFYVSELDEIYDSDFNHLDTSDERFDLLGSSYTNPDAINIYIVDYYLSSAYLGAATFPGYDEQGIVMVTGAMNASGTTFTHELGHYFNLYHTHQGYGSELVARTNCTDAGDLLCDTPADPSPSWYNSDDGCSYDEDSCQITACGDDAAGTEFNPNIGDIMSYYPDECNDKAFAVEQQQMMLCTMQEIRTELDLSITPSTPNLENSVGCEDSRFTSIQDAIDATTDGAAIEICDGTYIEAITTVDQSFSLAAKTGNENVVIDSDNAHAVIRASFTSATTTEQNITLSGITLTGGNASDGAAIAISASNAGAPVNLTLDDTTITGNTSTGLYSASVYVSLGAGGGTVTVNDSALTNNTQDSFGSLLVWSGLTTYDVSVSVSDSDFSGNSESGIYLSSVAAAILSNVTTSSNGDHGIELDAVSEASLDGLDVSANAGGGVKIYGGESFTISNSSIYDNLLDASECNTSTNAAAGLAIYDGTSADDLSVVVTDSAITDNDASACSAGSPVTGGIFVFAGSVSVDNTEVLRNTAGTDSYAGAIGLGTSGEFDAHISDFGNAGSADDNTPYDISMTDGSTYVVGNHQSFFCSGETGDCE